MKEVTAFARILMKNWLSIFKITLQQREWWDAF